MKKLLLVAILLSALSPHANAGTYSNAVAEQEECQVAGDLARAAYNVRQSGVSLEQFKPHTEKLSPLLQEVSMIGFEAQSSQSAYMRGWAKCKD